MESVSLFKYGKTIDPPRRYNYVTHWLQKKIYQTLNKSIKVTIQYVFNTAMTMKL